MGMRRALGSQHPEVLTRPPHRRAGRGSGLRTHRCRLTRRLKMLSPKPTRKMKPWPMRWRSAATSQDLFRASVVYGACVTYTWAKYKRDFEVLATVQLPTL